MLGRRGDDEGRGSGRRLKLWLLLLAAVVILMAALFKMFPDAVRTPDEWASVTYMFGLVVLVSAGLLRTNRRVLSLYLRDMGIWAFIVAVLALGYAYKDEFAGVSQRLRIAFNVGHPVQVAERELLVPQNDDGAYIVMGKVNGQAVRFLVDTGATDTVLSPQDARRLGVPMDSLRYTQQAETANGTGYGAPYVAKSLEVGPIRLSDIKLSINQTPLSHSLLGLSFLRQLDSFEFKGSRLLLRWREPSASAPVQPHR